MVYHMERGLTCFVLAGIIATVGFAQNRYIFENTPLEWKSAQFECRNSFTDLATIESAADNDAALSTISNYTGKAWIGLGDDLQNSWTWSFNDTNFYMGQETFRKWGRSQPNNVFGKQYCVELVNNIWNDFGCITKLQFVCFNVTSGGTPTFVKIGTPRSWTDAQRYCRKNYVDLASVRNEREHQMLITVADQNRVWIGLNRQQVWSDGSDSLYRNGELDAPHENCVAISVESGLWSSEDCFRKLPFVCHQRFPPNVEDLRSAGQNETSVTLQWNRVQNMSFILQFNGTETNITAPDGSGPVTHTVSSLTSATGYTLTVITVFENVRSNGVSLYVVTAPQNPGGLISTAKTDTSVALQWNKLNNSIIDFILQFNETETNITATNGDGPVNLTLSSLTPATEYNFTVFSVFENVRSSGVSILVVTETRYHVVRLKLKLRSNIQLSQTDIQARLEELMQKYGLPPSTVKIKIKSNP